MFDWYTILKFVHVLLAIIAVGFNASYGIWIARAAKTPEHLGPTLRGIKVLDDRFANPAYGFLLITGLLMVWINKLSIENLLWLKLGIGLWILAVLLGLLVYTPTLRRQIAVLESDGPDSATYRSVAARGTATGILLAVIVVAIVFVMVTKP